MFVSGVGIFARTKASATASNAITVVATIIATPTTSWINTAMLAYSMEAWVSA